MQFSAGIFISPVLSIWEAVHNMNRKLLKLQVMCYIRSIQTCFLMYHSKLGLKLYTRTTTSKINSVGATGGTGHGITGTWFVNQIGTVMSLCGTFHSFLQNLFSTRISVLNMSVTHTWRKCLCWPTMLNKKDLFTKKCMNRSIPIEVKAINQYVT